jgi:DNA-cytosine methyltransferase
MRHASLFSGIGGFDLAAEWMGWENVFAVEKDPDCHRVLRKNFPNVELYEDIKEFEGKKYYGTIDIISGGFPCQPFSVAGKQKSKEDDRYLWPQMLRVIREVKPTWIVGENVPGIISLALDTVLSDLENEGYTCQTFVIPACAVNAIHKRDRVWILAYSDLRRDRRYEREGIKETATSCSSSSPNQRRRHRLTYPVSQPTICRGDDGVPYRLDDGHIISAKDRNRALKQLGNAVVPQLAYEIFRIIQNEAN